MWEENRNQDREKIDVFSEVKTERRTVWNENQEFNFGHTKFEMAIRYTIEDTELAI